MIRVIWLPSSDLLDLITDKVFQLQYPDLLDLMMYNIGFTNFWGLVVYQDPAFFFASLPPIISSTIKYQRQIVMVSVCL